MSKKEKRIYRQAYISGITDVLGGLVLLVISIGTFVYAMMV